ncbi:MAG TPA: PIN domain-containing protein [Polyangia bacterium]|nr:PIN domain-containing protein [Polyangia bacterium]
MAGELLLDTSALVSVLDRSQSHHRPCSAFFRRWTRPVLTTEAVVTEATHLLGRFEGGASAVLRFVLEGGAVLVPGSTEALARAEAILRKYADLALDYADATLVVLAEEAGTGHVFTLDRRGFGALRWGRDRPFQVHP